jgi:hypothetical protein
MSIVIVLVIVLVVAGLIVRFYPHPKTTVETPVIPSIHEEITKTVEETKIQQPIVDEVSKTTKAKATPKMDATPAKKSATKKK